MLSGIIASCTMDNGYLPIEFTLLCMEPNMLWGYENGNIIGYKANLGVRLCLNLELMLFIKSVKLGRVGVAFSMCMPQKSQLDDEYLTAHCVQ